MRSYSRLILAIVATAAMVPAARADFVHTSFVTPNSTSAGGSALTLTGVSSATPLSGTTFVNLMKVTLASTTPAPATDAFSVSFTDALQITNVPVTGIQSVGSLNITGTLNFTRSDSGGEISTFTLTSAPSLSVVVDSVRYTVSNFTYTPPTVNSVVGSGNISALITPTATPEPASLMMLGMGIVGVVSYARRRKLS